MENPRDPVFANHEKTAINLTVDHPTFGEIPFTAASNDPEEHGRDLFEKALAGKFGKVAALK